MPPIPHVDVKAQYAPLLPELKERLAEVLEAGVFILGPNVKAFEQEAAAFLGVPQTVGVANGTVGARWAGAPCRCPQFGQVHDVVPGGMWNRWPQFSHVANTHRAPQRTHV